MREFLICYEEDTDKLDTLTIYAESARAALKAVRKYDVNAEDIRAISDMGEVGAQESDEACNSIPDDYTERWTGANKAVRYLANMCNAVGDDCSHCPIYQLCGDAFSIAPQDWSFPLITRRNDND